MVSSFTSRPVSSLRDQPVSPSSSQSDSPAFRPPASTEPRTKQRTGSGESYSKSPLLDDRHSSPGAASLRSSDYSFSRRSASTALTPVNLDERLPSIASLDFSNDKHSRTSTLDSQSRWQDSKMSAVDKTEPRRSPPPPAPVIRRPNSPAGRVSNHSAEWEMHSDRGSPRPAASRHPVRVAPPASHPSYPDYPSSPRMSAARSADPYRDIHPSFTRDRAASPPLVGVKRKSSISDNAIRRAPAARMERPGRSWPENQRPSLDYYADRGNHYRGRERNESPERSYSSSHDHSAYAPPPPRYAADDDPRYSPRRIYPASPSGRADYSRAPPPAYHGAYPDRRSDRYSPGPPMRSPPYTSRGAPQPHASHHDPYARPASHAYPHRTSSPPTSSDPRPQLPPLSSRPPPAAADYSVRSRYTPPPEAVLHPTRSRSPEIPPYPEAFYPDRRLFFTRDRIQDGEMDEYYHGPQRKGAEYDYEAYSSPHAHYAHPGAKTSNSGMMMSASGVPLPIPASGTHGMRGSIDGRRGYPGSYGAPDFLSDPRDPHGRGRPGPTFPAALVPPGPSTGIAPPPRRRGKLPKPVTDLLKSWLLEHAGHPYPTEDEKRTLCSMTGLTLSQVSNWFINARRRILLPSGSNGSPNASTAAQVKAAFSADSASPEP